VAAVIVGARPIKIREVAVAGKIRDATGVVVGLAESVLRLAGKIFGRLATKVQFERIALLVAFDSIWRIWPKAGLGRER